MLSDSYNFHITAIRDELIRKVRSNTEETIFAEFSNTPLIKFPENKKKLPQNHETVVAYYKAMLYAESVGYLNYSDIRQGKAIKRVDLDAMVVKLMWKDLDKVTLPVALVAWLTIDSFRWHRVYVDFPEELSYGLVLDYADFVIPYATFIHGCNRENLFKQLTTSQKSHCDRIAVDSSNRVLNNSGGA